jgi:Predicted transcriptional regulators
VGGNLQEGSAITEFSFEQPHQALTLHSSGECILHHTMARLLRIGEMAKQAGVKVSILRYYDARGLLPPAYRAESGYRFYTPDQKERLQFILEAKQLGLNLRQIEQILQLSEAGDSPCERVALLFQRMVARIEERIAQLRARRDALYHALAHAQRACLSSPCGLLTIAIDYQRRCMEMARLIEVSQRAALCVTRRFSGSSMRSPSAAARWSPARPTAQKPSSTAFGQSLRLWLKASSCSRGFPPKRRQTLCSVGRRRIP